MLEAGWSTVQRGQYMAIVENKRLLVQYNANGSYGVFVGRDFHGESVNLKTAQTKALQIAQGIYQPKGPDVMYHVPPKDDIAEALKRDGYQLTQAEIDKAASGTTIKVRNIYGRRGGSFIWLTPYDVRRTCTRILGKTYHRPASEYALGNRLSEGEVEALQDAKGGNRRQTIDDVLRVDAGIDDVLDIADVFEQAEEAKSEIPDKPAKMWMRVPATLAEGAEERELMETMLQRIAGISPETLRLAEHLSEHLEPHDGEVRYLIVGKIKAGEDRSIAKCLGDVEQVAEMARAAGPDVRIEIAMPARMVL